jgi:osmotically-inducible protein OsmY
MSARARKVAELLGAAVATGIALVLAKRLRKAPRPSDVELLEILRRRLRDGLDLPANTIELVIQDGVVELIGEVDTPEVADELVRRAGKVRGVVRVENALSLPEAPVR